MSLILAAFWKRVRSWNKDHLGWTDLCKCSFKAVKSIWKVYWNVNKFRYDSYRFISKIGNLLKRYKKNPNVLYFRCRKKYSGCPFFPSQGNLDISHWISIHQKKNTASCFQKISILPLYNIFKFSSWKMYLIFYYENMSFFKTKANSCILLILWARCYAIVTFKCVFI